MKDKILEFSGSLRAAGIPVSLRSTKTAYKSTFLIDNDLKALREVLASVYVKEKDQREKFDMIFNIIFQKELQHNEKSRKSNKSEFNSQMKEYQRNEAKKSQIKSKRINKAVTSLSQEIQNTYINKRSEGSKNSNGKIQRHSNLRFGATKRSFVSFQKSPPYSGKLNLEISRLDNKTRQKAVQKLIDSGYKTEDVFRALNQHDIHSNIEKMSFTDLLFFNNMTLNQLYPKMMDLCQKLGKKIATKRSRRFRVSSNGKINIRKTIRKNMKFGGVFLETVNEKPKLNKMNHFFLSDISASCDWISNWFFCIIYASQRAFNKVRVFEYDNETVEITSALDEPTIEMASDKVFEVREKNEKVNRCSNMFSSFKSFIEQSNINNKSYVVILTDCRDWMGPKISEKPRSADLIHEMVDKSKRVLILNPESKIQWNKFGSCVSYYEDAGAELFSVQNLEQLANLISEI